MNKNLKSIAIATVLAGLVAPAFADPAPFCVAVNGGFGNGGSSFVARNFELPQPSKCAPWTGYTKTAATVILTTNGTACASNDGSVLTISLTSADPDYLGVGQTAVDYLRICSDLNNCPIGSGTDAGYNTGSAQQQDCTDDLLDLPTMHD